MTASLSPTDAWRRAAAIVRSAWAVRGTSLRIGLSFVVPLAIGAAFDHTREGAVATGGAWVAIYARDEPYHRRAIVMAAIALALTSVVVLGTLLGGHPVAVAIGAGIVAGVGSLACHAYDVGRPREFFLVLSFLAATRYPGSLADAPGRAGLVLTGAAAVIALSMVGGLRRPRGPEERVIETYWSRMADLLTALGTPKAGDARHELLVAIAEMRRTLEHTGHHRGDGDRLYAMAVSGEAVADAALGLVLRDCPPVDPGWPLAARQLRAAVRHPAVAATIDLPDEAPGTIHGERFARMVHQAVFDADPKLALATTLVPFTRRRRRGPIATLRRAAHPGSLILPTALRVGIGVAAGTAVGLSIDDQRGIWVGLTTAGVLLASNVRLTARRATQRMVGTILGVGLAAGIFAMHPSVATIIVALAICQVLMQSTLFTAYGVASFFATPIALLIVDLGVPGTPPGSLLGPRIVDTIIGCGIGLLARRLLWPRTAATRLGVAQATVVTAARNVLHAAMTRSETPSSTLVRRSRRELHAALLDLHAVQQDAVGDLLFSSRAADDRFVLTKAVERVAYAAMGFAAPREQAPRGREHLEELDRALDRMAAITQGFRVSQEPITIPDITSHPATYRALLDLRHALHADELPAGPRIDEALGRGAA
ncbi:MAG: FUSC family protein [Solirubrobacteraceae bacterium]|nr:FUSC family protein [Patulibacter sp.]